MNRAERRRKWRSGPTEPYDPALAEWFERHPIAGIEIADRVTLDQHQGGADWSSPIAVLARSGDRELWWHMAGKCWSGRGTSASFPAELLLVKGPQFVVGYRTLHEGGRLSKALLRKHSAEIDAFFGREVSKYLHPQRTVLITAAKSTSR